MDNFINNLTVWNTLGYFFYSLALLNAIRILPYLKKCSHQHKLAYILIVLIILFYFTVQTYWLWTIPQQGALSLSKELWIAHDAITGVVFAIILSSGHQKLKS